MAEDKPVVPASCDFHPATLDQAASSEIVDRIRETRADRLGRAYVLRLDWLVARLGERWKLKRHLVFEHLDTAFLRRFPEPNWCAVIDETAFIAIVPTLGQFDAANAMAELWRALGQFFCGDVSDIAAPLYEVELGADNTLALTLIDPGKHFDRDENRDGSGGGGRSQRSESAALTKTARLVYEQAVNLPEGGTDFMAHGRPLRIGTLVEPVFEMKNLVVIGHRFEPIVADLTTQAFMDNRSLGRLDWGDREEIDLINLKQGLARLADLPFEQRKMVMVVPASFSTFASVKARARLTAEVGQAARAMSVKVIFELRHLAGVPPSRVSEIIGFLRPFSMTCVGNAAPDTRAIAGLKGLGLGGISIELDTNFFDDSSLEAVLCSLSTASRTAAGACMIQGFRNFHEVAVAKRCGVTHASTRATVMS